MPQKVRIALDAMGGDVGASVVIPGAAISLKRHPDSEFLFYGDSKQIDEQLGKYPALKKASQVVHTDVTVSMHDKPSQALRRGRKNDLGASIGGDAHHLVSLAIMGSAMASVLFGLKRPTVGLLNIGVEEVKGGEEIRKASEQLRAMNLPELDYIGFVEGDGIGAGAADVIVSEGFSGNIALKAAEGTARQMADFLRNAMASSWQSKIGYLFARSAFKALRNKLDPNKSNGGMLLGLKGLVVKSHGGINAEGFAYAVDVGYEMVRCDLLTKISALVQAQIAQEVVS